MNLTNLFDLSLQGRRETAALEFQESTYTFGEIDSRSNRMAQSLLSRGVKRGDRVCAQLGNCVEMIDLFLACVKLGAIFVPINVLYRDREVAHILGDAQPALTVTAPPDASGFPDSRPACPADGDTPVGIIYTSGTTGTSKGAILTHNNFEANALNLLACWQITADDRLLLPLPLFHVHGLGNGLHCWLISGCRMRLLERFDREKAQDEFRDFRPTVFFGVPTIYVRLLDFPEAAASEIGREMRLFVSGSAPLSAQTFQAFQERYGHAILERYGMSETLMNMSNPYVGERRPGTVGLPLPGVSVKLVDGEIYLKGPNLFAGYWGRDSQVLIDGWFPTGDLAEVSADGYYTLTGRKSDLIISGGYNIYPRAVEEFLEEQPEVAEAAVRGAPDAVRGEVPVAFVVLRTPVAAEELENRCRQNLASFKIPRAFHMVERLPRNALGKIQKHLLPVTPQ